MFCLPPQQGRGNVAGSLLELSWWPALSVYMAMWSWISTQWVVQLQTAA